MNFFIGFISGALFVIWVASGNPDRNAQYYWDKSNCISETRTDCKPTVSFLYSRGD